MQKGLALVTLPRGEWVRYVTLTDQGEAHAKTLLQNARRPGRRLDADAFSMEEWDETDRRLTSESQAQRRWARRQETYRRARRKLWLEPE
jgi:DNA-binding PadR family transcriptional regulator